MIKLGEIQASESFCGYVAKRLCTPEEKAEVTLEAYRDGMINWDDGTASDAAFYIFGPRWTSSKEFSALLENLAENQLGDNDSMEEMEKDIAAFEQTVLPSCRFKLG